MPSSRSRGGCQKRDSCTNHAYTLTLSLQARRLVEKASTVFVSSASLWEVAIKHSLGKLPVGAEEVRDHLLNSGAEFLPIMPEHCLALAGLPSLHNDPFDRMLIAQALVEPLHLITHDEANGEKAMPPAIETTRLGINEEIGVLEGFDG